MWFPIQNLELEEKDENKEQGLYDSTIFIDKNFFEKVGYHDQQLIKVKEKFLQIQGIPRKGSYVNFGEIIPGCSYLNQTLMKNLGMELPDIKKVKGKLSSLIEEIPEMKSTDTEKMDQHTIKIEEIEKIETCKYMSFTIIETGGLFGEEKEKSKKKLKDINQEKENLNIIKELLNEYVSNRTIYNVDDHFKYKGIQFKVSNINQNKENIAGRINKDTILSLHFKEPICVIKDMIIKEGVDFFNVTGCSYKVSLFSDYLLFEKNTTKSKFLLAKSFQIPEKFKIFRIEEIKFFEKMSGLEFHHYVSLKYKDKEEKEHTLFMEAKTMMEMYGLKAVAAYGMTVLPVYAAVAYGLSTLLKSTKSKTCETKKFYDIVVSTIDCNQSEKSSFWWTVSKMFSSKKENKTLSYFEDNAEEGVIDDEETRSD